MKQMFYTRGWAFCVLLLLAVTLIFWSGRGHRDAGVLRSAASEAVSLPSPTHPSDSIDASMTTGGGTHAAPRSSVMPRIEGLPASLQGSEPDGSIALDEFGNVRATPDLRRLFDYFLSAIGEVELPEIRVMLHAHSRSLHGVDVAERVLALFDRYVAYQRALAEGASTLPSALDERLALVKRLRRAHFDNETALAFFGDEETYADYTLARMRIVRDQHLDQDAREESLRALERTLPAEQRALMQDASTALIVEEQSRQFEALDMDQAARHRERSALFGDEAAVRLAALDRDRAAWDNRVAAYVQARNALRSDAALGDLGRERRIAELRQRSFDSVEARRVISLESIGQL